MVSAIERVFSTTDLNILAELESWRKEVNRPTYHMHKWWATRLGSVVRAILIGALSDEQTNIWDNFYSVASFPGKVVLDPFMGAGTTIGEALKLGCHVIGSDINPISTFQVRKALEPVDVDELIAAFAHVEEKVKPQIREMYQSIDPETNTLVDILYCFWVMTAPCPNCRQTVDLFDTSIFAKNAYPQKAPDAQSVCFECGYTNTTRYDTAHLQCGGCDRCYNPQEGIAVRDKAQCPHCPTLFKIAKTISDTGKIPTFRMYALLVLTPDGRKKYMRATPADVSKNDIAATLLQKCPMPLPTTTIEIGHNTNQILRYNYKEWQQLFNHRQQYCLSLLLQAILEEPNEACRELLLILFSGTLEFNNMFCSYKGEGTGAVRHLFNHHVLKPERMALENSIWGTPKSSGCFSTLFESRLLPALSYRQEPFELAAVRDGGKVKGKKIYGLSHSTVTPIATTFHELSDTKRALLFCSDSSHLNLPDASVDVVVTDPPYFDFVNYSELADFFYAWLRSALQHKYAEFNAETTRHPQEVQQREAEAFSLALQNVLSECKRVLKPGGLLIFSFHHSRNTGWAAVGEAIFNAGLGVVAVHPIKAELSAASPKAQTEAPINYDAILVCKHQAEPISAYLQDAINITMQRANNKIRTLAQSKHRALLSTRDHFVITQAEALCVFSQHIGHLRTSSHRTVTFAEFLDATSGFLTRATKGYLEYVDTEQILV